MSAQRTKDFTLANAVSLTASFNSGAVDATPFAGICFQTVFNYTAGTSAGTTKLQTSLDGTNWADYPSSSVNFTSTSTNNIIEVQKITFKWVRMVVTNTSGTGGLITILVHGVTQAE